MQLKKSETAPTDRREFLKLGASAVAAATLAGPLAAKEVIKMRRVLWAANVRSKSLSERLSAAQIGKFDGMSVFPIDYMNWRAEGLGDDTIRAQIDDAGIEVVTMDPFVQWVPGFVVPEGYPADYVSFIDYDEDAVVRMADVLGARQINCVEGLGQPHERNMMVDALGGLADRMSARGISLSLEPMPISSIVTLRDGWDLISAVNHDALGLCFDTWHFWRAEPDHDLLATIPLEKFAEVQLADAKTELRGDLTEDLLRFRLFAGDGDFDIAKTMEIVRAKGPIRSMGPERFADAMDALDANEAGRQAGVNLDQWS